MLRGTTFAILCILIIAALSPASAQVQFYLGLTVRDAADSIRTIKWGVHPLASFGIDTLLYGPDTVMEVEQPPFPPLGAFDARWTNPPGHGELGLGTKIDIRQFTTPTQIDTYRVKFQPSTGGYPVVLSWPKLLVAAHYGCPVHLKAIGVGGTVEIDMRLADSLVITDNTITVVTLTAECPGPDLIEGTLFDDLDGNGSLDGGEPGLAGWKVYLGGDANDTTLTDGSGTYQFPELPPGSYTVSTESRSGWVRTMPGSPSYAITIGGGEGASGRDFGVFHLGVLRGFKFIDTNGDGLYTPGEAKFPGWTMFLSGAANETTQTGPDGYYEFSGLGAGQYIVREKQDSNYVQLRPGFPGFYAVTVTSGTFDSTLQFGNKIANVFVGQSGGNWSDSSNWSSGHPPSGNDVVVITVPIVIDALPRDTIVAIRIAAGASVTYQTGDTLIVLKSFQIDSGSTLAFSGPLASPTAGVRITQPQVICFGSWINNGTFVPGNSLITFAGDSEKVIGPTQFYDLQIAGKNTSSGGDIFADKSSGGGGNNIMVTGTFTIGETFELQAGDTLFIENSAPGAIEGTGLIAQGTIVRAIQQGSTQPYRFESPLSYVQFGGSGVYPSSITMTVFPGNPQPYPYLKWKNVPSIPDPGANNVTATDITSFSWWTFGQTGAGGFGTSQVSRQYVIHAEGGSGYTADLGLRYDESELALGTDESALHLLKGPYYVDTLVGAGWHMLSLPVSVASAEKDSVFPASPSLAFAYENGAYALKSMLAEGIGYWLKFNSTTPILIEGVGIEQVHDTLHQGWNLIGGLSVPVDPSAFLTAPADLLTGILYRYAGSYVPSTMLNPMEGHWIKSTGEGSLTITAGAPAAAKRRLTPDLASFGTLTVSDTRGNSQTLYFGAADEEASRRYELPPPSPEGTFGVRFASQQLVARPGMAGGDRIVISGASYPVTISWVSKPGISAELLIGERHLRLSGSGSADVATAGENVAVIGSGASVAPLPAAFRLSQNYPNPFNPSTVIAYDLPRAAFVKLVVYNTLGQSVAVLAEELVSAGRHEVRWSATDVPSGVYFYRLTAVDPLGGDRIYTDVQKMILMK